MVLFFFFVHSLLQLLAGCCPKNGMCCVVVLQASVYICAILTHPSEHCHTSTVTNTTAWDDQQAANSIKFALTANLTLDCMESGHCELQSPPLSQQCSQSNTLKE